MRIVGRVVARGKTSGLFIPFNDGDATPLYGAYNVVECMGELTLQHVGTPALPQGAFEGLGLSELFHRRPSSIMTAEELRTAEE